MHTFVKINNGGVDVNGFGVRLKQWRVQLGLTQEELADRCATSANNIRNYEKNRNTPSYETIIRLCDAMLVNPDYLMQDDLGFNPYEDKNETFNDIAKLTPADYQLVKGLVNNLKNRGVKR